MKKLLAIAAFTTLFTVAANAQFNMSAGYSLSIQHEKPNFSNNMRSGAQVTLLNGFYISAGYDFLFAESSFGDFSVNPELKYTYHTDGDGFDRIYWLTPLHYERSSYREHYLSLPIDIKYSYELGTGDVKLFVSTGPVLAYGLYAGVRFNDHLTYVGKLDMYSGKYSLTNAAGVKLEGNMDNGGYSRFDFRWGVGIGVEVDEDYIIKAGYDFGLLDRYKQKDTSSTMCMDEFHIGVAYLF